VGSSSYRWFELEESMEGLLRMGELRDGGELACVTEEGIGGLGDVLRLGFQEGVWFLEQKERRCEM
jgi:hypothetical protein